MAEFFWRKWLQYLRGERFKHFNKRKCTHVKSLESYNKLELQAINVAIYIERVPNRNSAPTILLRESYRQAGKVLKRTLANLPKWPPETVEKLQQLLKGADRHCPAKK